MIVPGSRPRAAHASSTIRLRPAHLGDRPVRVPAVGVLGDDPHHLRAVGAEGQRRTGLLQRRRAEGRLAHLVVAPLVGRHVLPQQAVDHLDRLAEAGDQLGRLREVDAEHLVLRLEPAGAEPQLQPAVRDVVDA